MANGNKIKLFGYAKLFFNEMTDMVKTSSYKDRGFYFYMSESFFDEDEFVSIIKKIFSVRRWIMSYRKELLYLFCWVMKNISHPKLLRSVMRMKLK